MSLEIHRPDWQATMDFSTALKLNTWFDEYVEPINAMLREGVEVYGNDTQFDILKNPRPDAIVGCTHSAFLINITPIKEKSREEKLEECLKAVFLHTNHPILDANWRSYMDSELRPIITALLENKDD